MVPVSGACADLRPLRINVPGLGSNEVRPKAVHLFRDFHMQKEFRIYYTVLCL